MIWDKEASWWETFPRCLLEMSGHTKPSPTFLAAFQSVLSSCLLSLTPLSSLFAAQDQHELNLPKGFLDEVSQPGRTRAPRTSAPLIFQEKVMESCLESGSPHQSGREGGQEFRVPRPLIKMIRS